MKTTISRARAATDAASAELTYVGRGFSPAVRRPSRVGAVVLVVLLLVTASGLLSQGAETALTIDTPPSLAPVAERVRRIDRQPLAAALARAGLRVPPQIRVTLIPNSDPRARDIPVWIVGLASGSEDIAIFPERIGVSPDSYPYDSLESVVWHEVVHLALAAQAGGGVLPRWFHEGVAMSVEKGWGVTSHVQLLLAAAANPDIADLGRSFNSDTQPEAARAYLLATALVSDIRDRHGQAVPGAIVDRVARGVRFADAFALETGETPDDAAADAWQPYRRWTSWIPVVTSASSVWIGIMVLAMAAFVARLRKRLHRRRQWDQEELDAWRASHRPEPAIDETHTSGDSRPTIH